VADRRAILAAVLLAAPLAGLAAPAAYQGAGASLVQRALEHLRCGRHQQAERAALTLARGERPQAFPEAWLIVAAARRRSGRRDEAIPAYRSYLASCTSPAMRHYAMEQIRQCRSPAAETAPRTAPSQRLTPADLRALMRIGRQTLVESSEHFVVRARNSRVARLIAVEAEKALHRICRDVLAGQEFPHRVDVYVWSDRREYAAHAQNAPEWSGGNFSIVARNGLVTRRIDLTQLDRAGRFATIMLDRVLPHELCHLVLQEYFGDATCPLLIDEGLAMLAENGQMDNARILLAGAALGARKRIVLAPLLARRRDEIGDPAVFYAKAFSFVEFLHSRMSRGQFGEFLAHVKNGCSVGEAIQRALYLPLDRTFSASLARAWQDRSVRQAQYLRALDG